MQADCMQGTDAEALNGMLPQSSLQNDTAADTMPLLDAAC